MRGLALAFEKKRAFMASFEQRWFMFDFARGYHFHRPEILALLNLLRDAGYNGLVCYLEGAFAFRAWPGVCRRGVMTHADAAWLKSRALERGLALLPATNVFYHAEHFLDQERFVHMRDMAVTGICKQVDPARSDAFDFMLRAALELGEVFSSSLVHIGGDEAVLKPEQRNAYAAYLCRMARALLVEGFTPCVWGDMFWSHQELAAGLPRETVIFDWNYYGHRPDSLRFFRRAGFVVTACPSDNSWEQFINFQHVSPSGYQGALKSPAVAPEEVEAFLADAKAEGVAAGCLTFWQSSLGNPFWAQLAPLFRAGLFMRGDFQPGTDDETAVEHILFGRKTPYTQLTRLLQQQVCVPLNSEPVLRDLAPYLGRRAAYNGQEFRQLLLRANAFPADRVGRWADVASFVAAQLGRWMPLNPRERMARDAMYMLGATLGWLAVAIRAAVRARELYHEAAEHQFDEPELSADTLEKSAAAFNAVIESFRRLEAAVLRVERNTGHPRIDRLQLRRRVAEVKEIQRTLRRFARAVGRGPRARQVALPAWLGLLASLLQDYTVADWLPGAV